MTKRMLIDATHEEETRVAVVDGSRLVEFDYESKLRKQLKGSIFLAKITRVEPSLQAAFVNFGGNRHGFLPFSEIHPDYFRIPIADREALLAEQKEAIAAANAAEEAAIAAEEAALERQEAIARGEIPAEPEAEEEVADVAESEEEAPEEADEADESDDQEDDADEETDGDAEDDGETDDADDETEDDTEDEAEEAVAAEAAPEAETAEGEGTEGATGEEGQTEGEPRGRSRSRRGRRRRNDRKLVYKVIAGIDEETLEFTSTHETEPQTFELELAQKIKEKAEAREDVVRARLWGRENDSEGAPQLRSIWVALREDNPEPEAQPEVQGEGERSEGDEAGEGRGKGRGRGRGRGRFQNGGRGRGRSGGRGGPRQAFHNRQVEVLGGDGVDSDQSYRLNMHRNYKIQEVIKRGQIMLIQVQKEERGNKGAAVTTYLSLPGRYCVLMPNSPRGGGVSRKIASIAERKRMREILSDLPMPEGMSVILRTAGVAREQDEIKRDLDYLTRLWDNIRDLTLQSSAPAGIYEESNLVKRAVRDIYSSDIEEILVAGEKAYTDASNFMKMLMPTHIDRVKHYADEKMPLLHRYQVENQIAEMGDPQVTLRSGGYLVIHPTEALVSVDVNSGRATKERHIEETALKTNLEAADEVARQLRLRDLGGLIVIDFIDMEDGRNNVKVERRLKEALSNDRARIQIGRISSFGLLELSRQRLNPSVTEAQFEKCSHCQGVGVVRTVDSASILALRSLEEEGIRNRSSEVILTVPNDIAIYILNNKRAMLADIERRYDFSVLIRVDDELAPTGFKVESVKEVVEEESRATRMDDDEYESRPAQQPRDEEAEDDVNGNVEGAHEGTGLHSSQHESRRGGRNRGSRREGGREGNREGNRERGQRAEPRNDGNVAEGEAAEGREQNSRNRRGRNGSSRGRGGQRREGGREQGAEQGAAPVEQNNEAGAPVADAQPKFRAKRFQSRRPAEAADSASIVTSSPSNDQPQAETPSYESQEGGDAKKKGWWNRLMEK